MFIRLEQKGGILPPNAMKRFFPEDILTNDISQCPDKAQRIEVPCPTGKRSKCLVRRR